MTLSASRHLAKVNAERTQDSRVKMREQISGTGSYNSRKLAESFLGASLWTAGGHLDRLKFRVFVDEGGCTFGYTGKVKHVHFH